MKNKIYLGDGAYVEFDGFGFILTAENGIEATDTIVLEPEHIINLNEFVSRYYETTNNPGGDNESTFTNTRDDRINTSNG